MSLPVRPSLARSLALKQKPHPSLACATDQAALALVVSDAQALDAAFDLVDDARLAGHVVNARQGDGEGEPRIVVGEVRGAEAFDMLQALNTGHDGSLSTCHANSAVDALRRLSTMVLLASPGLSHGVADSLVAGSVDLVVHMARNKALRQVADVIEVRPPGEQPPFRPVVVDGEPIDVEPPSGRWGR